MFDRPHHQRIEKLLHCFNSELLLQAECYFGGGTAIVLSLGEYRESIDVDFLCASKAGYRLLRNTVSHRGLGALLQQPVTYLREVRADFYGIRTFLEIDDVPVKVEIVSEPRNGSWTDKSVLFLGFPARPDSAACSLPATTKQRSWGVQKRCNLVRSDLHPKGELRNIEILK